MLEAIFQSIPLAIVAATPLLLLVQGELVVQRSGIINLGLEGMLLAAAFGAAIAASGTSSILAGVGAGILAAALIALLFGWMAITLKADQIVTGTAVNFLVIGLTGFAYRELPGSGGVPPIPVDVITPAAWLLVPIMLAVLLWHTPFGLKLRASGENPDAVRSASLSPSRYRWSALFIEALLAGVGGSHLALALSNGFAENMTAGRGFIALAVVIFGRWTVRGSIAGSALFGITVALQYALQASNRGVPYHLLLATPYLVTLLILCGVTGRVRAPEALGKK